VLKAELVLVSMVEDALLVGIEEAAVDVDVGSLAALAVLAVVLVPPVDEAGSAGSAMGCTAGP
jgi:hypothetical protein